MLIRTPLAADAEVCDGDYRHVVVALAPGPAAGRREQGVDQPLQVPVRDRPQLSAWA
ncbi:hypothetical protein ABZ353_26495 [Streptomyces niveus]|uniref:hypothetical protein n=1 Tax=Streptomyces niveus TaxID=193462 RepID=UPI0033FCC2AA